MPCAGAEIEPKAETEGPKENTGLLCLGGPKHNRNVSWRGELWEYREGEIVWQYRWVKLALSQGEFVALTKDLYILNDKEKSFA